MKEKEPETKESMKEYQQKMSNELSYLRKEIDKNFPNRSFAILVGLSVIAQRKIEGITQPFALIVMGAPSTLKSTILEILGSLPKCYRSDSFTPRSFVSHSANASAKKLKQIDLLPKIQHKTLITPELAPLFSGNQDEQILNFGMLTRILDGRGFKSDSGVHGQRGYEGDYYFNWLGAVIDVPHRSWRLLGNLGPKIYFFRLPEDKKTKTEIQIEIKKSLKENSYSKKLASSKDSIQKFWELVENIPDQHDDKVIWDTTKDDEDTLNRIVELAMVLANLRATIPTWQTWDSDSSGANYNFETPTKEYPSRASSALYNLARGHALLNGRNYITKDDLCVVIPTALSSAPIERVNLFKLLVENNGLLNTELFVKKGRLSRATARKEMEKLKLLGLVDKCEEKGTTKPILAIKLKEDFAWFLTPEFKKYWDEFTSSLDPKNCELSPPKENSQKKGVSSGLDTFFK